MTTTDLSDFGYRELHLLNELITAMIEQGLPDDFYDDGVVPMFNAYSGNVFLTNSDYQVAMMNGDKLESFYYLSYHGTEGFADDLYYEFQSGNIAKEDCEQLADILEANGMTDEATNVRGNMSAL